MNLLKKIYYRICQSMRCCVCFVPWKRPEKLDFSNGICDLPKYLVSKKKKNVFIVASKEFAEDGILVDLFKELKKEQIEYSMYSECNDDLTEDMVNDAYSIYFNNDCDSIIAIGGETVIDCAKGVGIRVVRPDKELKDMVGDMKVAHKIPYLITVPCGGFGNETSPLMTYNDRKEKEKKIVFDISVVPNAVLLDSTLTEKLDKRTLNLAILQAIAHDSETYLSNANTFLTKEMSLTSIETIFEQLPFYLENSNDKIAIAYIQEGLYQSSLAYSGTFFGYAQALANSISGYYGISTSLATAVLIPHVLEFYIKKSTKKLSHLADFAALLHDSEKVKARMYIDEIISLREKFNIEDSLDINPKDIPLLVERAFQQAIKSYAAPKLMRRKDMKNILLKITKK